MQDDSNNPPSPWKEFLSDLDNYRNVVSRPFVAFVQPGLRKQRTQESLIKAWLGHSTGNTITDLYDRTSMDLEHRKMVAKQVGIGFEIRPIVLSILENKSEETEGVAVAA